MRHTLKSQRLADAREAGKASQKLSLPWAGCKSTPRSLFLFIVKSQSFLHDFTILPTLLYTRASTRLKISYHYLRTAKLVRPDSAHALSAKATLSILLLAGQTWRRALFEICKKYTRH